MAFIEPFPPTHITQTSYIHGQTHQPVVWWITAGFLLAKGIYSHLKAAWALMDVWQASETSHSKSSPGNFSINTCLNCYSMCTAILWLWKVCLVVVCVEAGFSQIQSQLKVTCTGNYCRNAVLIIYYSDSEMHLKTILPYVNTLYIFVLWHD